MLPSRYRLPSPLVRRVLAKGKRTPFDELSLTSVSTNEVVSRVAFVVSTKVDKRATARNRIKRILSESVWQLLPSIRVGNDIVFVVRRSPGPISQKQAEEKVRSLLQKASLLAL